MSTYPRTRSRLLAEHEQQCRAARRSTAAVSVHDGRAAALAECILELDAEANGTTRDVLRFGDITLNTGERWCVMTTETAAEFDARFYRADRMTMPPADLSRLLDADTATDDERADAIIVARS